MNYGFGCQTLIWLIGNISFCTLNIIAAFYIAVRFNQLRNNPIPSSTGGSTQSSGIKKTTEILCYDPFVAIYILALLGYFIWLCIGFSWMSDGCDYDAITAVSTALGCGFSFFVAGFVSLCFSVCCSCFCNEDRRGGSNNNMYTQNQYGAAPSNYNNSNVYNQQPTDVEYAAPVSATPVAAFPVTAGTPSKKSSYHEQQQPVQATVVVDSATSGVNQTTAFPSAPPMSRDDDSLDGEAKAAAKGTAVGASIGKLFKTDQKTQAKLETAGAKANVALTQAGKQANTALKKLFQTK